MFLLVPAYPGCPGSKAVKRSLLLFVVVVGITMLAESLVDRVRSSEQIWLSVECA